MITSVTRLGLDVVRFFTDLWIDLYLLPVTGTTIAVVCRLPRSLLREVSEERVSILDQAAPPESGLWTLSRASGNTEKGQEGM